MHRATPDKHETTPAIGEEFHPAPLLGNGHLQTILNSVGPRRWHARRWHEQLDAATTRTLLDCDGVRLECFYTPAPGRARGLAVLFHGWEGSAESAYMLSSACGLVDAGFSVIRLNFRDHGDTHHLNRGLFHACRLDEVVTALRRISDTHAERPLMLAGFSLGANFALRAAARASSAGFELAQVFSICPVINPWATMDAMERSGGFYHHHFMRKWTRSLRRKQALFPDEYHLDEVLEHGTIRSITRHLVQNHGDFASTDEYLAGYEITAETLAALKCPTTILAAADDPINPVADFRKLERGEPVKLVITPHGGHCGYIEDFAGQSWAEHLMVRRLTRAAEPVARRP